MSRQEANIVLNEAEGGKDQMKDELIELLKFPIHTMKKAILEKAPKLAKYLNLEDAKD